MIWWDIVYCYKQFFSWNLAKLSFLGVSIAYGLLAFLPFMIIMLILWWIDPINWIEAFRTGSFLWMIQNGNQIFWSIGMLGIFALGFGVLFLVTSYYVIFIIRMYHAYVQREKHSLRNSIKFSFKDFLSFLNISALNILVIFFPVVVWILLATLMSSIFGSLSWLALYTMRFLQIVAIIFVLFFAYKTQFSYVIFALKKEKKSAFKIIKKSWRRAKNKYFISFLLIAFLYFLVQAPFQSIDSRLENKIKENTLMYNYKNDFFTDLSENDRKYLEFVAQDYEGVGTEQMLKNIQSMYNLRILHFIIMYLVFGSLYILIVTSFYSHCLIEEKK